jgi:hypothetical protein
VTNGLDPVSWRRHLSPSVVTFMVAAALIAARRPDQIRFPEAWNEDGIYIAPLLVEYGWKYILVPVNGYLIVPSKVISYLAVLISFVHYPAISTALSVAAQAACVTVVASAPTVLPARLAMAAALIFLPANPETFVLPEYTIWWTPLLIFVAILWSGAPLSPWRYLLLVIGGISSPVIIATLPVLAVSAAIRRRKPETLLLIAAVVVAAIQAYYVLNTDHSSTNTFRAELVPRVIEKFFGLLTWAGQFAPLSMGCLIAGLLTAGVVVLPKEDRLSYCLIGGCLLGTIASAVYRAPIEILSPLDGGPRYFFYPFILELWMFIWLAARSPWRFKALPALVIVAVAPLSAANFARHQERLASWTRNAIACSAGVDTAFRIHHDGIRQHAHSVLFPHALCEKGTRQALLDSWFVSSRPASRTDQ